MAEGNCKESYVLNELCLIRDQLKRQLNVLAEREKSLEGREVLVSRKEAAINEIIEKRGVMLDEVEQHIGNLYSSFEDCIEKKIKRMEHQHQLHAKTSEQEMKGILGDNARLKESFVSLKESNKRLKKQLATAEVQCAAMKKQVAILQARLSSLQSSVSKKDVKEPHCEVKSPIQKDHSKEQGTNKKLYLEGSKEQEQLLCNLIQWTSKVLPSIHDSRTTDLLCTETLSLLGILLPKVPIQHHCAYLQFICIALFYIGPKSKSLLSSSLRRIGEVCIMESNQFCGSANIKTRMLSSLVVLQSISQVDAVCRVLMSLKCDLREREADVQGDFLKFGGVQVLLPYMKPLPKFQILCMATIDIFILLSSEDQGLQYLLNEKWFDAVSDLLRNNLVSVQYLEKLSILLQRLSLRQSKVLFESSGTLMLLQSLLKSKNISSSFLQLNLSSIITNLGV